MCVCVGASCDIRRQRSLISAVAVDKGVCVWVGVCMCVLASAWRGFDTGQTTRSLIGAVAVDEGVCVCGWVVGWICVCVCTVWVGRESDEEELG